MALTLQWMYWCGVGMKYAMDFCVRSLWIKRFGLFKRDRKRSESFKFLGFCEVSQWSRLMKIVKLKLNGLILSVPRFRTQKSKVNLVALLLESRELRYTLWAQFKKSVVGRHSLLFEFRHRNWWNHQR